MTTRIFNRTKKRFAGESKNLGMFIKSLQAKQARADCKWQPTRAVDGCLTKRYEGIICVLNNRQPTQTAFITLHLVQILLSTCQFGDPRNKITDTLKLDTVSNLNTYDYKTFHIINMFIISVSLPLAFKEPKYVLVTSSVFMFIFGFCIFLSFLPFYLSFPYCKINLICDGIRFISSDLNFALLHVRVHSRCFWVFNPSDKAFHPS